MKRPVLRTSGPILLADPGATLLNLDGGPIHEVRYEETEHDTLTKEFLDSPARFFQHLFAAGEDDAV